LATRIVFYSLDAAQMRGVVPLLEPELGPLAYLGLGGVKDIVLQSTGAPMPLLHLQYGPCAQGGVTAPVDDHVHMFCLPEGDPLVVGLGSMGHRPTATASVMHHRMGDADWRFILTSDI